MISPAASPAIAAIRPPLSKTISRLSTVPSRSVSVSTTLSPINLSPCGFIDDDIAVRADFAGLSVPDDLVGGDVIAVPLHPDRAGSGDDVGVAVVGDLFGAELDDLIGSPARPVQLAAAGLPAGAASGPRRLREQAQAGAPSTRQISTQKSVRPLTLVLTGQAYRTLAALHNPPCTPPLCHCGGWVLKARAHRFDFQDFP